MLEHLKRGFFYTAIGKYSNVVVQLVVSMVLSRLLTPKEFGVVAVVQVFLVFFSLLVDAGLGPAIIENKTLTDDDNRILFAYGIRLGILLALIFIAIGPLICLVYNDWAYMGLTAALSVTLLFQGFNTVPNALLDKAKRFREVNIRLVIGNVLGGIAGIVGAIGGLGAYALVLGSAVPAVVAFALNLLILRISPARKTSRGVLDKVLSFAKNQFGFNFINYFSRNADNLLIGKFMGPTPLANYSKAYQLLMMPNYVLLGIITPVLQPVLSDYKDDVPRVREAYLKIIRILAFIGMPLSIFLSVEAKDIIYILYGNQWDAAVPAFRILALTVWIQMTLSSSGAIFQALDKSRWLFITGNISAVIIVSSIIVGVIHGNIYAVAVYLSIGFAINFFVSFSILSFKALKMSILPFLKSFLNPTITVLIYCAFALPLSYLLRDISHPILRIAFQAFVLLATIIISAMATGNRQIFSKLFRHDTGNI